MNREQAELLQAIFDGSVKYLHQGNFSNHAWGCNIEVGYVLVMSPRVYLTNAGNDALQAYLSTPVRMMSYCVDINGQWYSDEMPEDEFDEETAVERTVHSRIAGGTYSARLVYASYSDGTFVNYGGDDE